MTSELKKKDQRHIGIKPCDDSQRLERINDPPTVSSEERKDYNWSLQGSMALLVA